MLSTLKKKNLKKNPILRCTPFLIALVSKGLDLLSNETAISLFSFLLKLYLLDPYYTVVWRCNFKKKKKNCCHYYCLLPRLPN